MTAAFLALLLASPAQSSTWVESYRAKAERILRHTRKPLTKARIERAIEGNVLVESYAVVNPVSGSKGDYVLGVGLPTEGAAAFYVTPDGSVKVVSPQLDCLVDHAQQQDRRLLLGGTIGWYGNGPRYQLSIFTGAGKGWSLRTSAATKEQVVSVDIPPGLLRGGAVSLGTRTYPQHMNSSHASAMLYLEERFSIHGARVRRIGATLGNTAYNTLDRLAGALLARDKAAIAKIAPSSTVREKLALAWKEAGPEPSVSTPGSINRVDGTYYQWGDWSDPIAKLRFHKVAGAWKLTSVELPKQADKGAP